MSFFDPRDGDLEDDASSTSHHSLLGHATHLLLEISLPKLALAALLLLALPALLFGAAPKAAIWFGAEVWRHIPELGQYLSAGFFAAILGLLAGMAVTYALKARGAGAFLRERAACLPLPLAVGVLVLVPPQVWVERVMPAAPPCGRPPRSSKVASSRSCRRRAGLRRPSRPAVEQVGARRSCGS